MIEVPLNSKKYPGHPLRVIVVNQCDVAGFNWQPLPNPVLIYARGYVLGSGSKGKRNVFLHRLIMDAPKGVIVDHIDGNTLDCRKQNLRLCTQTENSQNRRAHRGSSSQYRGVTWDKSVGLWKATIRCNNKKVHIGYYSTEVSAALEYDEMARELDSEFWTYNFPREGERGALR